MAVGDHPVGGIYLQPNHVAHQVGGKLTGKTAPVGVAPQELGGIAIAIRQELGLPVRYIGVGEQIDDLQPFNAREFIDAIF